MIELEDGDAYLTLKEWCAATGESITRFYRRKDELLPYQQPTLYLGRSLTAPLFRRSRVNTYAKDAHDYKMWAKRELNRYHAAKRKQRLLEAAQAGDSHVD